MITFFAPCSSHIGYGVHSYNLMYEFSKLEKIALIPPFGKVSQSSPLIDEWLDNARDFSEASPSIMIFQHQFMNQFCGTPRIGFPVFELEEFSAKDINTLKNLDYILQPSHWGKSVLNKLGFDNVYVVPEGFNPRIFQKERSIEYKLELIKRGRIEFVHVGKYEERKGTKDILRCFVKAFKDSKQVITLKAHVYNPFNDWILKVNKLLGDLGMKRDGYTWRLNNLVIQTFDRPIGDVSRLYKEADFGIWLSKAEGWNLPLLECLACKTPAITTCNTGMTEYLKDYPKELLLEKGELEFVKDNQWYDDKANAKWFQVDLESVVDKLKDVERNPEKYLRLEYDVKDFTWENSAKTLMTTLKDIT